MRQATNREKAAKIAEKDPFGPVDEQLDKSAASEEANAATMAQVHDAEVESLSLFPERHAGSTDSTDTGAKS